jgi:hypothetical protein
MTHLLPLCDPYVWEKPDIILSTRVWPNIRPEGTCVSELINQVILVYILAIILGMTVASATQNPLFLWGFISAATLVLTPSFWFILYPTTSGTPTEDWRLVGNKYAKVEESFQGEIFKAEPIYEVIGGGSPALATIPTAKNPFMNVLIDEIKYNPTRPQALSINDPSMKVTLDDFFRTEFNRDPTDVFGRSQSQRQFVTMPNTSIPNDQGSYQNWLYKIDGKTCKEGGREACLPGTDGGKIPWINFS